jgi:hypothetical protein
MLVIDPAGRLTADEALQHPYFAGFLPSIGNLEETPTQFDFSHEQTIGTVNGWKGLHFFSFFIFF